MCKFVRSYLLHQTSNLQQTGNELSMPVRHETQGVSLKLDVCVIFGYSSLVGKIFQNKCDWSHMTFATVHWYMVA